MINLVNLWNTHPRLDTHCYLLTELTVTQNVWVIPESCKLYTQRMGASCSLCKWFTAQVYSTSSSLSTESQMIAKNERKESTCNKLPPAYYKVASHTGNTIPAVYVFMLKVITAEVVWQYIIIKKKILWQLNTHDNIKQCMC